MNLKKYLPSKTYVLTTRLSIDEVKTRIAHRIEPYAIIPNANFNDPLERQYEGRMFNDSFQINQKTVGRRNSFAPLTTGHISSAKGSTRIDIKMEILPFTKNVLSLFLGFTGFLCILLIIVTLGDLRQLGHSSFGPKVVVPFILFAFGCLLAFFGFKTESENTKYFLEKLLEGKEEVSQ